jgi:hypothetical protein
MYLNSDYNSETYMRMCYKNETKYHHNGDNKSNNTGWKIYHKGEPAVSMIRNILICVEYLNTKVYLI